ncbi:MAG: NUDIX domain-containing protein [Alphaproteobacteria bacterium]|nr:NUDIX domain-containing protein [Alphaproteobacteria bacterium]
MPAASAAEVPIRCRAVAVAVLSATGAGAQLLLVRRGQGAYIGEWSMITGRMEAGETAWQAAVRETREEAGLALRSLYSAGFCDTFYSPHAESIEVAPVFVGVARDGAVVLNEENTDFRWASVTEAAELVPFHGHRVALAAVERDFVRRTPADWRRIPQFRG